MKIFYKVCILSILLIFYITNLSSAPKDTVYIKGDAHFPPYEYLNEEGEPEGYNIDLIQAIMQELDTPYIIKLGLWSDAIRDLENKNIDVLTSMIFTKERSLKFSVGISHLTLKYVIVYNNKSSHNTSYFKIHYKCIDSHAKVIYHN